MFDRSKLPSSAAIGICTCVIVPDTNAEEATDTISVSRVSLFTNCSAIDWFRLPASRWAVIRT